MDKPIMNDKPTIMDKPTMDYKRAAENIRAGAGDLPLVTSVLAELLDTLAESSSPTQSVADESPVLAETPPVYPSSDEHPETLTLPQSDA